MNQIVSLLMFGPPGAGKGTQAAFLVKEHGLKHLSTGNLFRDAAKKKTNLGLQAAAFMKEGKYVPDSLTLPLVQETLEELSQQKQGFILDGFPRTLEQAEVLEGWLMSFQLNLTKAIFFEVPHEVLVHRLMGRWTCSKCSAVYNVETTPPKEVGTCDLCNAQLSQRADDRTAEQVEKRLSVYKELTAPLKAFYAKKGLVCELDGSSPAEKVFENLKEVLDKCAVLSVKEGGFL